MENCCVSERNNKMPNIQKILNKLLEPDKRQQLWQLILKIFCGLQASNTQPTATITVLTNNLFTTNMDRPQKLKKITMDLIWEDCVNLNFILLVRKNFVWKLSNKRDMLETIIKKRNQFFSNMIVVLCLPRTSNLQMG